MKTPGRRGYVRAIFSCWSANALSIRSNPPFCQGANSTSFFVALRKIAFLYSMDNNHHATLRINETSSSIILYAILEQQNNML